MSVKIITAHQLLFYNQHNIQFFSFYDTYKKYLLQTLK